MSVPLPSPTVSACRDTRDTASSTACISRSLTSHGIIGVKLRPNWRTISAPDLTVPSFRPRASAGDPRISSSCALFSYNLHSLRLPPSTFKDSCRNATPSKWGHRSSNEQRPHGMLGSGSNGIVGRTLETCPAPSGLIFWRATLPHFWLTYRDRLFGVAQVGQDSTGATLLEPAQRATGQLFNVVNAIFYSSTILVTIRSARAGSVAPIAPRTFLKAAFMFAASGGTTSSELITHSHVKRRRPGPAWGWGEGTPAKGRVWASTGVSPRYPGSGSMLPAKKIEARSELGTWRSTHPASSQANVSVLLMMAWVRPWMSCRSAGSRLSDCGHVRWELGCEMITAAAVRHLTSCRDFS